MDFGDILYRSEDGVAIITINRPQVLNAFRSQTVDELVEAFKLAWADRSVGAVILTGAGERAFCTGGDQSTREEGGYKGNPVRSDLGLDIEDLHSIIRDVPKPVIAAVNGYAIGGGHVLHVICDLTIASETAKFGQVGPKVGSVDPGFGTMYLARIVGEKKAREMWYLCEQFTAAEAKDMGLVNKVVPAADLMTEALVWGKKIAVDESDRDQAGEGIVQRAERGDPRHRRGGVARAFSLLRDRGGAGREKCIPRKAQTRLPQIPTIVVELSGSPSLKGSG